MPNIPSTQNTPDAAPTDGWRLEHTYARLPQLFHAPAQPVAVSRPGWVMWNRTLAESLGLNPDSLAQPAAAAIFAGNALPTGSEPIAQAYAGHQYGHFTALGDGRAILLGEQITPSGERFDIQLKGAGATPFSRRGDGRAALGPMLREYIISEAMHALGIATTRSLAVVTTGDTVYRQQPLAGAVLTRVAASHIRVGTFEWAAARGDTNSLRALADYTLARHDPLLAEADNPYAAFLEAVVQRQAALVAQWMHVGFVHGVMNTDNMAVCGETIDYGPCAFLDAYDPATVFSSIDQHGRYAYGNQPHIAQWNLARLAESLLPLLHDDQPLAVQQATDAVGGFRQHFQHHWLKGMRSKLGLWNEEPADAALADDDRFRLLRGFDDDDGPVHRRRHAFRRTGELGALGSERRGLGLIDVVHHEREARFHEIERHRSAHGAESDESDLAGHVLLPRLLLGVRRRPSRRW